MQYLSSPPKQFLFENIIEKRGEFWMSRKSWEQYMNGERDHKIHTTTEVVQETLRCDYDSKKFKQLLSSGMYKIKETNNFYLITKL